ncbi:hypothetical protein, partial [Victivallis vadensis]|uniref:hypothetical protein n=1 Tax=Victivallis vadensis TaxID=172901 RepID=UPI0023F1EE0F
SQSRSELPFLRGLEDRINTFLPIIRFSPFFDRTPVSCLYWGPEAALVLLFQVFLFFHYFHRPFQREMKFCSFAVQCNR